MPQAVADTPVAPEPAARGGMAWLAEGARVLAFRTPRWEGLEPRPLAAAVLVLAGYPLALVTQRVLMAGSPTFQWTGLLAGWFGVAVMAWLCWVIAKPTAVTPGVLFCVSAGAFLALHLIAGLALLLLRPVLGASDGWPPALLWTAWLGPLAWAGLAQITLLWRAAASIPARMAATLLVPASLAVSGSLAPVVFWWPESAAAEAQSGAEPDTALPLTDESIARQARLLATALQDLKPPQRGRVNVYAATYAPNASEDVFMRESAAVAKTMRERFGADGRLVELVANRATSDTLPWGTPANLRETIQRMAAVMDRDRDVLFLHLTSHGGRDGQLANDTWPLKTEPMTPELLKQWLDEAGVRWRVISVSACFSGSWIAPLAGNGTLVMTAADADHTSYGCGRKSELTFFGRAMYADALQETLDFEAAHEKARQLIDVREKEAGKTDGYSNPQLRMGDGIRPMLLRLRQELERRP